MIEARRGGVVFFREIAVGDFFGDFDGFVGSATLAACARLTGDWNIALAGKSQAFLSCGDGCFVGCFWFTWDFNDLSDAKGRRVDAWIFYDQSIYGHIVCFCDAVERFVRCDGVFDGA